MKPYRFCRGIRTALLASALAGSLLASCNFGMPLPNYTVMRQGRNYTLLASYRIALDQSLPEARFGFAILDGASAANGSSPICSPPRPS